MKRAVEIDAGIAVVPQSTITQEIAKQTLAVINIEGADLFRPIALIHKRSKVLSTAMKQFIALLKEG